MNESDALLLDNWKRERNAEAFKTLAARYAGMVYGTCRRILNNSVEAEDAAQECFEILATTEKPVGEYLAPWLHRAACNRALTRLRSEHRRMERETRFAAEQETAHEVAWNDVYGFVDEAIADLPDKWRVPVVAHFLDDQTHAAIAQTLGIPRRTVTDRIDQGVEQLRKALTRRGVAVSTVALAGLIKANAAEAAPATLVTGLGKLALSGTKPVASVAAATAAAKLSAGFWTTKTVIAVLASLMTVVGLASGYWTLQHRYSFGSVTAPLVSLQQAAKNTQGQGSGTDTGVPHAGVPGKAESTPEAYPAREELGAISGRVYNVATGRGIPFTAVKAVGPSGEIKVNTSLDGGYEINGLVSGEYWLSASAPFGFVNSSVCNEKTARLIRGARLDRMDIERVMGVSLSGFVRDQAGRPVSGAHLEMSQTESSPSEAISEKDGSFKLTDLSPKQEKLWLSAHTDNLIAKCRESYSLGTEDVKGVEIVLEPAARVSGQLVDGAGSPVTGMHMDAWPIGEHGDNTIPGTTTDENGKFVFPPLEGGTYTISVDPHGNSTLVNNELERLELDPGEHAEGLVLVYDATIGMRVAGRVTDPAGKPLRFKHVECLGPVWSTTITDEDGRFENARLSAGYYKLAVEGRTVKERFIPDGKDLEIVLDGPVKVQCHIVDRVTGEAVPRFQAYAFPESNGLVWAVQTANMPHIYDADGRYWMDLEPGNYRMCVRAAGYRGVLKDLHVTAAPEEAAEVEIALDPAPALEVRVLNEQGAPVADAGIQLSTPEETQNTLKWGNRFYPGNKPLGRTGSDGIFRTDALEPDDGVVYVSHRDYGPSFAPLRLGTPVTVRLEPGGVVQGIVEAEGETRPERFRVLLSYPDKPALGSVYMDTERDGRFHFDHVLHGTVEVRARAIWYHPDSSLRSYEQEIRQQITVGESATEDLVLRVPTGDCTLTGGVHLDGMPFGDFTVEVRVTGEDGRETLHSTTTGFDGRFSLDKVPAGQAVVSIRRTFRADSRDSFAPVTMNILPGQNNHVEFAYTAKDLP